MSFTRSLQPIKKIFRIAVIPGIPPPPTSFPDRKPFFIFLKKNPLNKLL
jgi:hypothetical protein